MLPDTTIAIRPGVRVRPEVETEGERLVRILSQLRSRRKRIMVIIDMDGSITITRLEREGSFAPIENP